MEDKLIHHLRNFTVTHEKREADVENVTHFYAIFHLFSALSGIVNARSKLSRLGYCSGTTYTEMKICWVHFTTNVRSELIQDCHCYQASGILVTKN